MRQNEDRGIFDSLEKRATHRSFLDKPVEEHVLTPVSYTHLRAHATVLDIVCCLLLEQKK